MKTQTNDLVLNYNDAIIYGSDLALLESPTAWLNDACINFFLELTKCRLKEKQSNTQNSIALLDPSVVFYFVHHCTESDEIEEFVASASLPVTGKIFIPVNDGMVDGLGNTTSVGTHWSLLVLVKQEGQGEFWYFDSMNKSGNGEVARLVSRKFEQHFLGDGSSKFINARTPQQSNGFDCALHVLATIQLFSCMEQQDLESHERLLKEHVDANPNFCLELRRHMVDEIQRLLT
jgi:Ulp1 family protease